MGLDTPELSARCPRDERLARAAQDRMRDLIAGCVYLEPHGQDRYDRLLAVVRDQAGRDVAQIMIRETCAAVCWAGKAGGVVSVKAARTGTKQIHDSKFAWLPRAIERLLTRAQHFAPPR